MNRAFNQFWEYLKSRKYIILFSFVYFLIRMIRLDSYFLLRDERDLILTSLSLAQTGKDLYGHSFPIIFSRISPQVPLLGIYWAVPFISFFKITAPIVVKTLYLLPTLFFPHLVFELILAITKEKKISLLTALVVSFSPWYFHISRLGIEAHLAYFFCLLGLIIYFKKIKILGFFLFILSYFSYFGIRPFIFISIPYLEFWMYIQSAKKSIKKTAVSFAAVAIFIFVLFAVGTTVENTSSRIYSEVMILNEGKLSQDADFLRTISDAPFAVRGVFDNKVTLILHSLFESFFKGIDFSYLFFSGDYIGIYTNGVTGQFFPFLLPLLILGIYAITKKNWRNYYFIASLSIVGMVSSLINSYSLSFSIRSIFSLIGMGFICTLGLIYIYELIDKKWRMIFTVSIFTTYILFSIVFAYKYFFQNYKLINDSFNEEERYVAHYSRNHDIQTIMVPNSHTYFLSYLVTSPLLTSEFFKHIQAELNGNDKYAIESHRFIHCNAEQVKLTSLDTLPSSSLIEQSCLSESTKLLIDQNNSKKIIEIPDPKYKREDSKRAIKYYYFK